MLKRLLTIGILLILGLTPSFFGTIFGVNEYTIGKIINGTNEGSYEYGWQQGSLKSPSIVKGANWYPEHDNNTCALGGAVTNTTACEDGWFNGWKNWCTNHAIDCVGNITLGYFPMMHL